MLLNSKDFKSVIFFPSLWWLLSCWHYWNFSLNTNCKIYPGPYLTPGSWYFLNVNIKLTKHQVDETSSWQNIKLMKHQVDETSIWWNIKLMKHQAVSAITNGRETISCLGRVFNSKLGCFATLGRKCLVWCMQPLLKLKTRPKARPVS